ncbi:hypothetical protein JL108_04355 [Aeromicrobium sp. YIM 150415]|uniref:hypothetical protein n=1 Tax=Aeromicrobium sp. YIM 150415 TaxID=2803912 RepID=UPI001962BAB5|nr:hypothetical protein [Aeromicrobium sp. YIM 150415]MBM9462671.1 hypothetical protein [Aeromicrobium sp. YIM 150415]
MVDMPVNGREAAHVLLDMISAFDPEDDDAAAMKLAMGRMNEIGAVTATFDDETDAVDLDATGLMGGTLITLQRLITLLATAHGVDEATTIIELREFIDS